MAFNVEVCIRHDKEWGMLSRKKKEMNSTMEDSKKKRGGGKINESHANRCLYMQMKRETGSYQECISP
jgi:hypothetical protein